GQSSILLMFPPESAQSCHERELPNFVGMQSPSNESVVRDDRSQFNIDLGKIGDDYTLANGRRGLGISGGLGISVIRARRIGREKRESATQCVPSNLAHSPKKGLVARSAADSEFTFGRTSL